jgi:biotin synthase-related radical SAM superfamily protein
MLPVEIAEKKAELLKYGTINIPKELTLPFYPSLSTAGPGAGRRAMVFGFFGTRVKLGVVRDGSAIYSLARAEQIPQDSGMNRSCIEGKPFVILKNGKPFLADVRIEPTLMHAPCQAFINITSKCIYNCSFCTTPELEAERKECTVERWIELILAHAENSSLQAVAITSGVAESPHKTILDMVTVIKGVRDRLPEIPIGVEPYITSQEDIDLLYQAGANEIKINLEAATPELFDKVCPGMDYPGLFTALQYAVKVFGRNKVTSNIIIGLGETDSEILKTVEDLAKEGIVATLRAVRINDRNKLKLTAALGHLPAPVTPERMIELAKKQKMILDKYSLTTQEFETMCHKCKSCDIVPHQDV